MKKIFLLFIGIVGFSLISSSQCTEAVQPKVLLVGDSWAFFMNADQTINNVFKKWGHSDCTFFSNLTLAENGATTDDFLTQVKQDEIVAQLNAHPSIEYIHLSIGGNDALNSWNVNFTQAQTDSMVNKIANKLLQVIYFCENAKPGIKVFWSGYVYPNFEEVIESFAPLQTSHPFYGTWEGMGFPTFIQLNTILNVFTVQAQNFADADPNLDFVNCSGLMQYTFGQNSPLGVAPGGTYPPFTVPLPYGDPNYPSPKNSMRDYGITKDCFHLSPQAYRDFVDYHTQKFYHHALMDDYYSLASSFDQTGTISSTGLISDTLLMGEMGGETFSSLLTFSTAAMADTGVSKASIFLRREALAGNNPISGTLHIKLKTGYFGAAPDLETIDLTAAVTAEGTPCLFGSNSGDADWIRLDLPAEFYPHLQKGSTVQFIISAPDAGAGVVRFSNSTNPDFAPVLNIAYGQKVLSIDEAKNDLKLEVFPNPTNGIVNFKSEEGLLVKSVEVRDLPGKLLMKSNLSNQSVDISALPAGVYILKLTTQRGTASRRVVKN